MSESVDMEVEGDVDTWWLAQDESTKATLATSAVRAMFKASTTGAGRREIVTRGGAPMVIELLENPKVSSCCCVVLGRIARICQAEVLSSAVVPLVRLIDNPQGCPSNREVAAFALKRLARHPESSLSTYIGTTDALAALVRVLQTPSATRLQGVALATIRELVVFSPENVMELYVVGGLEPMIEMVMFSLETACHYKLLAAEILGVLASMKQVQQEIVLGNRVPQLVEAGRVGAIGSRTRVAHALGFLAFRKRVRKQIVEAGGIEVLVDLLRSGDTQAMHVAGNALAIASANVDHLKPVCDAGAIPLFVDLLQRDDPIGKDIAEDAFCILAVAEENAVVIANEMVRILREGDSSSKAAAADIIWDISSYKHSVPFIRSSGAITELVRLLWEDDEEVREKAAGAVAELSFNDDDRRALAEAGAIPVLIRLLDDEYDAVKENALEALKSFSDDSDYENQVPAYLGIPSLSNALDSVEETSMHAAATFQYVSLHQFL